MSFKNGFRIIRHLYAKQKAKKTLTNTSHLIQILAQIGPQINIKHKAAKEFQSKTEPEDIKWKISHMCPQEDKT